MAEPNTTPKLSPREQAELDRQRERQRTQQPYSTELDNRELETAQKEDRPVRPQPPAGKP